ncbi:AI-2E family transporter, partial [Clostridium perfringens]|uniref:AI-2E family transporter n=1 Tax=Clostridium perfringens TaxID=1502 RepID=UPI002ACDEEC9
VIGLIIALALFVIPQLVSSISTLLETVPDYIKSFEALINQYASSTEILENVYNTLVSTWRELLKVFGQLLTTSLTGILNTTVSITSGVINFVLSIVLTIYMLASKETLIYNFKKLLYAFTKKPLADKIIIIGRLSNIPFSKFITGQCI